ncbi:Adaptor protein complex AP-3 delta subunit [Hyphopichia burtonii NRRL Y-1933]|uniref:AP-3 complex subunit delta n=1 Tax=Hyphopichia burtonii NRRL Y-1933 TaxID=984485 RepID=A0A1E4RHX5_9ASCO|nr:Adaptor protein complex AP-3 delta subunit [Hyphopichia burtonii NRRL Y-1933]ODV66821.1 Adaptor protein complex AP-3 delta subunit [Hyphopichia burtonii NRRL Y-1933]
MSSFQLQNSEVLARLKPFGISFEKSLSDLIKGIRAHSKDSPESLLNFLDSAISECKNELNTTDLETKAIAVLKLAYLEMYGFDMSWCNFQILEVMSSTNFQQKRIGYLAAIQSFKNEQDLLILATNQFKKDLNSHNHVEVGLALSGIATIVTPNLSKDINDDVLMKLNHSSPYIRKKAILAMYKIFLQYPESLRINFNRIIEKLDDTDVSVVSATINVICEISKKNPNIFVSYLPKFFSILEETENNWLIIRILKLFQSLSKVEPRMKKKILPIILGMMLKTDASSLKYECINCIINGAMLSSDSSKDKNIAKECIEQLMNFFETRDSNLKFVGLLALINIIKLFPSLMHKVKGVSVIVMDCLTDTDLIIKRKALEVCHYLVTEDNIVDLIKSLLLQLIPKENVIIPESLKLEISSKIIEISSRDNYENVPNFEWYIAVLKDVINLTLLPLPSTANTTISYTTSSEIATRIGNELENLACKIPSIRSVIINKVVVDSLQDVKFLENCPLLLKVFYWIMGEYIDDLKPIDDSDSEIVLIQALVKLYSGIVSDYIKHYSLSDGKLPHSKANELKFYLFKLIKFLANWENHSNYEVQERVLSWLEFLKLVFEALTSGDLKEIEALQKEEPEELPILLTHILPSFFKSYQLNPISHGSQRRIPIPEDLDLETVINSPPDFALENDVNDSEEQSIFSSDDESRAEDEGNLTNGLLSVSASEEDFRKRERLERMKDDPYYLTSDNKNDKKAKSKKSKKLLSIVDTDNESSRSPRDAGSEIQSERNSVKSSNGKKTKSSGKTKARKMKKEKVVILSEETVGGPELIEEPKEESKKKKKNTLKIDSSNLDNFDIKSESVSVEPSGKEYEYDVDLDAIRQQLVQEKAKKTSKKSKKKEGDEKPKKKSPKKKTEEVPTEGSSDKVPTEGSPDKVINVKPKKKIKKKAAKILD